MMVQVQENGDKYWARAVWMERRTQRRAKFPKQNLQPNRLVVVKQEDGSTGGGITASALFLG